MLKRRDCVIGVSSAHVSIWPSEVRVSKLAGNIQAFWSIMLSVRRWRTGGNSLNILKIPVQSTLYLV